jgi:hypothetical protein
MIKGLQGISGITVSGGNTSVPYVNQNTNNPITGMMRIWGSDMQVFDGSSWINMSTSYATVGLDQDVLEIVQWARKQRDEEMTWQSLAKDNKAVKIALDNLEQAKEQLKITAHLAKEEYETTS